MRRSEDSGIFAKKIEGEIKSKLEEPKLEEPKVEELKTEEPKTVPLRVLKVDGYVDDIKKAIESLAPGEYPVDWCYESHNARVLGKATYIFIIKQDPNSKKKCKLIDALGIEKLSAMLNAEGALMNIESTITIAAQVKRTTNQQQFLVILIGE